MVIDFQSLTTEELPEAEEEIVPQSPDFGGRGR